MKGEEINNVIQKYFVTTGAEECRRNVERLLYDIRPYSITEELLYDLFLKRERIEYVLDPENRQKQGVVVDFKIPKVGVIQTGGTRLYMYNYITHDGIQTYEKKQDIPLTTYNTIETFAELMTVLHQDNTELLASIAKETKKKHIRPLLEKYNVPYTKRYIEVLIQLGYTGRTPEVDLTPPTKETQLSLWGYQWKPQLNNNLELTRGTQDLDLDEDLFEEDDEDLFEEDDEDLFEEDDKGFCDLFEEDDED